MWGKQSEEAKQYERNGTINKHIKKFPEKNLDFEIWKEKLKKIEWKGKQI